MTLTPMLALLRRALSSVARHALVYAAASLVVIAAFGAAAYLWRSPVAQPFLAFTVDPAFDALIIALALADARDGTLGESAWSRAFERAWAVIVVNVALTYVASSGIASIGGGFVDKLFAIAFMLLSAALIYAPVVAVAHEGTAWWMLIGRSFGESVRTALRGANFSRALGLFALQFVPFLAGNGITALLRAHGIAHPSFWGNVPLGTFLEPAIVTITAFTYFDAIGLRARDACSE